MSLAMNTEEINVENEEALLSRHRKEKKELVAKIQGLKKSILSLDKKKKKEVTEEISRLEIDLNRKHADELKSLNTATATKEPVKEETNPHRISKAQKRRDKKANEEKERQAEILAQQELNKNGPRFLENIAIKKLLKSRGLSLHKIPSDGDCLYNAIIHQLRITECPRVVDTQLLRNLTAEYIETNKDTLISYMTNPDTDECLNDEEFKKYCDAVKNTPAWGGQIEIRALSHILKVPIEVLQASGPPTIQAENEYKESNLVITYHRHMYSLGAHYNSTKPMEKNNSDEDEEDELLDD